jgi:hypothetical protein
MLDWEAVRVWKDPRFKSTSNFVPLHLAGAVRKGLISLLAATTAIVVLALPGFAQSSYAWQLDCRGAAANGSGSGVSWFWLHDGAQIISSDTTPPNGFAACTGTALSGSAVIPATINGIQVNGIAVTLSVDEYPAGCGAFASVMKSFDPLDPKISIKENVSAPGSIKGFGGTREKCPPSGFSFSLLSI